MAHPELLRLPDFYTNSDYLASNKVIDALPVSAIRKDLEDQIEKHQKRWDKLGRESKVFAAGQISALESLIELWCKD